MFLFVVSVPLYQSYFGSGTGPIYFEDIECEGSESNIRDCKRSSLDQHVCDHSQDAGVRCQSSGNTAFRSYCYSVVSHKLSVDTVM